VKPSLSDAPTDTGWTFQSDDEANTHLKAEPDCVVGTPPPGPVEEPSGIFDADYREPPDFPLLDWF
jgi:hypothetical protein